MAIALQEAQKAFDKSEVPIGAVIIQQGRLIGRGHNLMETLQDPTAHAEMMAITSAANSLASWRLDGCSLYVTLEPCMMCTGAILLSRISTIIYGAKDFRYGACGSAVQLARHQNLDAQAEIISGILEADCSELIKQFFRQIRSAKAANGNGNRV
jgi:tRNA(adenine34) deaminase